MPGHGSAHEKKPPLNGLCLRSPCTTYNHKEVLIGRKRHY